jgi:multidrug efflux system membrane fusion protein
MSAPNYQDPAHIDSSHQLPEQASGSAGGGGLRKLIILVVILLVAGFVTWRIYVNKQDTAAETNKAAQAANRPIPVQVVAVKQQTVPVFLSALGTVTAYNSVTINSRVSGQLLQVNFTEGQAVHKGQLLLEIDPRPYQAALDQAIGQKAKDEANLKDMQAEAERYTALYQAGVVSKEQQQLEISNAGQAEGSIKADDAAIEAARVNLGYTKIYSPIEGVVGLRQVDPGNIVNSGSSTGLVVVNQIHPISVIFTLPEDQLSQVQAAMKGGKKLVVEAYDRSDAHKIGAGTLLTLDNQIDTTTGTAKLKSVFDNSDNSLFPNQFVNVRLILSERQNATVVPTAAIETGTQGDFVYVVNPGPTPPDKLKNLPNTGLTGATGGKGKGSKSSSTDGTEGATGSSGAKGKGSNAPACPASHADSVPVHVDFTLGTSSVLSDGALNTSQQVVVDGQEKLVDGSNVCPQQPKGAAGATGTKGASGTTGTVGATGSTGNTGKNATAPTPDAEHKKHSNTGGPTQ